MTRSLKTLALAVGTAALALSASVSAQDEYPLVPGDLVEVAAVDIADGAGLKYSTWLADQWVMQQEYAKSQGWITEYEILVNVHPREGEPDIYLVTRFSDWGTNEENEARAKQFREYMQRNVQQLEAESGDRAEYRTIIGGQLLQEFSKR